MKKIILAALRIYQKTISFDHGFFKYLKPFGHCKFYPSCSEYSYQSIKNRGIAQGTIAGLRRLIRCAPWSAGGIDLPYTPPLTKGSPPYEGGGKRGWEAGRGLKIS